MGAGRQSQVSQPLASFFEPYLQGFKQAMARQTGGGLQVQVSQPLASFATPNSHFGAHPKAGHTTGKQRQVRHPLASRAYSEPAGHIGQGIGALVNKLTLGDAGGCY